MDWTLLQEVWVQDSGAEMGTGKLSGKPDEMPGGGGGGGGGVVTL